MYIIYFDHMPTNNFSQCVPPDFRSSAAAPPLLNNPKYIAA